MPQIVLATLIRAAPAVCFDWARDAQLHVASAAQTGERIVAGREFGLWELGDEITFQGTHLGVRQRLSARIVAFERPHFFRDEMTRGAFAELSHTHIFQPLPGNRTRMIDVLQWRAPLGQVGALFSDALVAAHLRRFLRARVALESARRKLIFTQRDKDRTKRKSRTYAVGLCRSRVVRRVGYVQMRKSYSFSLCDLCLFVRSHTVDQMCQRHRRTGA